MLSVCIFILLLSVVVHWWQITALKHYPHTITMLPYTQRVIPVLAISWESKIIFKVCEVILLILFQCEREDNEDSLVSSLHCTLPCSLYQPMALSQPGSSAVCLRCWYRANWVDGGFCPRLGFAVQLWMSIKNCWGIKSNVRQYLLSNWVEFNL